MTRELVAFIDTIEEWKMYEELLKKHPEDLIWKESYQNLISFMQRQVNEISLAEAIAKATAENNITILWRYLVCHKDFKSSATSGENLVHSMRMFEDSFINLLLDENSAIEGEIQDTLFLLGIDRGCEMSDSMSVGSNPC